MAPTESTILKLTPTPPSHTYRSAPHNIEAEQSLLGATPRTEIEDTERKLYELAESGRYDRGFQRFSRALTIAIDMAANAYKRDGRLSGIATGLPT